jgi:hypothetical protein
VWHVKESSLLKVLSAKHRPVFGIGYTRQIAEKIARVAQNKQTNKQTDKRILPQSTKDKHDKETARKRLCT